MNPQGPDDVAAAGAPAALPSPAAGVDVWLCGLARGDGEIRELAALLSPAEHARAARFGRTELRDRYVAGRASLRIVLGAKLGMAPAAVAIERGVRGRPYTPDAAGLDFNVSHTLGVALVGVAHGQRIGVDIEHGGRALNVDGVARKFMSPREQDELRALGDDARRRALLRLWTCKEAMSKATGDALSAPFRRMDVDAGPLRLVGGPPPYEPARWRLHAVDVPGGFLATVALWHGQ
ncbi:MAG: 4'-phosphopantetheinyl transferase superfamily protein [Burkholderiales bacterium]